MRIAAVVFPRLTQLDLTAPYEVFSRCPDDPVRSEFGLPIAPAATFDGTPPCDVLFCPGGPGVNDAILDEKLLSFVRSQGTRASYVTSVCSGALILGAAGLLNGFRATTHWAAMEFLPHFGATPVEERKPFASGNPRHAEQATVEAVVKQRREAQERRREAVLKAAQRLRVSS